MNPRVVCRERAYQKALLLTYSFDPVFFEQVVLPDLWAGRSSDIFVLADEAQVELATQATAGQLWHLGKHYLLAGAGHKGTFHPKLTLRIGVKDGVVILGSGNVTSSGWGGNQELGTAWMVGPEHADKGGWLHAFLDDVMTWCSGDLERDTVRRMKDVSWLAMTPSDLGTNSPVLYSTQARSLGNALAQRWRGRQFDEVKILTGSTDKSGAFLRWAHATFGISQATVAITPEMSSFVVEELADLPVSLRLIRAPADRLLHAKFYWFDGPGGPAAVMGSANCSASAWLLNPNQGGNVETIVVFDEPKADEFSESLALFELVAQPAEEVLIPKPDLTVEQPVLKREFDLFSLRCDKALSSILAKIFPAPLPRDAVELEMDGRRIPMTPAPGSDGHWACSIPEDFGRGTSFASVCISRGNLAWCTQSRWIDDIAALHEATQAAGMLEPFNDFERASSSAEQRRMIDDLQEVAQALFNDGAFARDPAFGLDRKQDAVNEPPTTPVNPSDLIFHLEELSEPSHILGSTGPGSLSLGGILRLLFESEGEIGERLAAHEDENIDEGQIPGDSGTSGGKKISNEHTASLELKPVEERFRDRLALQMKRFLEEMTLSNFVNRCSATQMVQAVAFPLAVAMRGQSRGWVSEDVAETWALTVFATLFRRDISGSKGLLSAVERRYREIERKSTFDSVVGDGTLWVVLVATLGNARWKGVGTEIDKAVALREVFTAPELLASANPARLAGLLGKIRIDDARTYVAQVAPRVTELLNEIENLLRPLWMTEIGSQIDRTLLHKVGDLLWRENVGWAVCLAEDGSNSGTPIQVRLRGVNTKVKIGYYVNVSDLASRNSELSNLIAAMRAIVRLGLGDSAHVDGKGLV